MLTLVFVRGLEASRFQDSRRDIAPKTPSKDVGAVRHDASRLKAGDLGPFGLRVLPDFLCFQRGLERRTRSQKKESAFRIAFFYCSQHGALERVAQKEPGPVCLR